MSAPTGPIYWHGGMFLEPQLFQLTDRCTQSLFTPYQQYLAPHFWGVCRATISTSTLGVPSLEISEGEFLFPDGAYLQLPGNCLIEPRGLPEEKLSEEGAVRAYLGLRKWREQGENVATVERGESLGRVNSRFVTAADAVPCADLYGTGGKAQVRQLAFLLKIFWEQELDLLGDYLLIPLARVEVRGEAPELSRDFIPPCVSMAASPALMGLVHEIRDLVASRCRRLESGKSERGIESAEFGSKDLVYLLALRTLNRYLALLDHLLQTPQAHPWQLYGVLSQLVAELSTFSETVSSGPAAESAFLPQYRHLDLSGCFAQAHDLLLKLLDHVTAGPDHSISLSYDGNYFSADFKPLHFQGRNRFFLVLSTEEEPGSVLSSFAAVAKLSPRERLPLLISQALPGIALSHLPDPPRELPRRSSSLYFAVDHRCEQWEMVQKWQNVALFWDQAPADLTAELMIVSRS